MTKIWCVRGYEHEVEPPIEEDCPMCEIEDEAHGFKKRLKRATDLLREWRDKYAGKEHYRVGASVHPTDLIRDTQKFLEGK